MNIPETIELGPQHLLGLWVVAHFGYAAAMHYRWVQKARQFVAKTTAEQKAAKVEPTVAFCRKCMVKQLVPLTLFGLEFKFVQSIFYVIMWIASVVLGGGTKAPFKMRWYKDIEKSVASRYGRSMGCSHQFPGDDD